jgi:cytidylate kinase
MIITISGSAGSGKSTIAKYLAKKLNWQRYYIGGLRRKKAKDLGMTLSEYNKLGEKDPRTDIEVDEYQKEIAAKEDNFIMEGRTSWYFIPNSIKIFIETDEKTGAKRIFLDLEENKDRNEGNGLRTEKDVLESVQERVKSDKKRYKKYYGIDVYDKKNYDYVINTSNLSKKTANTLVYKYIKGKLENYS